ncbi:MAG: cadmium-translocating P-type ATPase [Bacteroidetes bacterium]|nr:cadmium-translocating P-type ATPase [Bacteroidota bacterium]
MEHEHQMHHHKMSQDHDMNNHHEMAEHKHQAHHTHMIRDFRKRFWISLIITLPIVVLSPMIQSLLGFEWHFKGDGYVQFVLSSIIFFYGGWPFLKGLISEIKKKAPGMMTLIALAITVAYVYSSAVVFGLPGKVFFWELASLIVIMLLGHWIEMKSVMGASNALQELAKMMPSTAMKIGKSGEVEEVPIDSIKSMDLILVRPGEKVPADGEVEEGESHLNESMLTGESTPVAKHKGDAVIGGSVNDNGTLKIRVKHTGDESYLSKVIGMVREAQDSKSKTQDLANKAAAWLFYVALGSGIVTLIVWLMLGKEFVYALERMVTVMIISCPHALGLAVPLVVAISTAESAKNGLLIRNRTAFENSRKITAIIFDKTGTLTKGAFGVTRYKSQSEDYSDEELLRLAASIESASEHPIAGGIVSKAKAMGLVLDDAEKVQNITGKGIQAWVNGKELKIVSPGMLKEYGISFDSASVQSTIETVVFVVMEKQLLGYIALADEIRSEAHSAVQTLKNKGIKVTMATGDNARVAKAVSDELSLDDYYAEVLPEDKQGIIKELQARGEFVAMTGDGVNDAPALAQADVGIAVGSGTDVAAETADIILVNNNPSDIVGLILFGAATYRKMMQNLWWAAGYNIVAVPLAAGVLAGAGIILSPAMGAGLMSLSTVIVALNAQLLKNQIKIENGKAE